MIRSTHRLILATIVLLVSAVSAPAQDQPSLDDLLNLPRPDARPQTPDGEAEPKPAAPDDETLRQKITAEQAANLFEQAVQEMQWVSQRIGEKQDPGIDTQRMQEQILVKLEQLVQAANDQQNSSSNSGSSGSSDSSGSSGSSQPRPQDSGSSPSSGDSKPGQQSGSSGQATTGSSQSDNERVSAQAEQLEQGGPLHETGSQWGNLPPRLRDELLQGLNEKFSSVYQDLTEAYYRALAEEGRSE